MRSLSISRRLWLILIVSVLMLFVLAATLLKQIHDDLYQAEAEKTMHVFRPPVAFLPTIKAWKPLAPCPARPLSSRP